METKKKPEKEPAEPKIHWSADHLGIDENGKHWFYDPTYDQYGPFANRKDAEEAMTLWADTELEGKPITDEIKQRVKELYERGKK